MADDFARCADGSGRLCSCCTSRAPRGRVARQRRKRLAERDRREIPSWLREDYTQTQ